MVHPFVESADGPILCGSPVAHIRGSVASAKQVRTSVELPER